MDTRRRCPRLHNCGSFGRLRYRSLDYGLGGVRVVEGLVMVVMVAMVSEFNVKMVIVVCQERLTLFPDSSHFECLATVDKGKRKKKR